MAERCISALSSQNTRVDVFSQSSCLTKVSLSNGNHLRVAIKLAPRKDALLEPMAQFPTKSQCSHEMAMTQPFRELYICADIYFCDRSKI